MIPPTIPIVIPRTPNPIASSLTEMYPERQPTITQSPNIAQRIQRGDKNPVQWKTKNPNETVPAIAPVRNTVRSTSSNPKKQMKTPKINKMKLKI